MQQALVGGVGGVVWQSWGRKHDLMEIPTHVLNRYCFNLVFGIVFMRNSRPSVTHDETPTHFGPYYFFLTPDHFYPKLHDACLAW
jgi:hypothetical protein